MFKQTSYRLRTILATLGVVSSVLVLLVFGFVRSLDQTATAAASEYLNFQARLKNNSGGIVADGNYNIEFKLYNASSSSGSSQGSCSGDSNCLWTETRTSGDVVRVANGYFSVNLGSITAFSGIDWSERHWLTMRIGGTGSPSWDAEMSPRMLLTAVPFAYKAGNVGSASTNTASTNSSGVTIQTGNATGSTSNSGGITIDTGTATGTAGTISLGAANTSSLILGRSGLTTLNNGSLTVAQNVIVQGNTTIGNANTDTLVINAGTSGSGIQFADSSFVSCTALETDANGDLTCGTDDAGGGSSLFTDGGNVSYLTSTTDQLSVGSSSDLNGKFQVVNDDTADYTLLLKNAASQTAPTLLATNSSNAELFRLNAPDTSSIFLGLNSGATDDGSNNNTGIGQGALDVVSSGQGNTALGGNALGSLTTSDNNTAIGFESLKNNSTGARNTAIGVSALQSATGNNNVGVGFWSLVYNTGNDNVGVGNGIAANAAGTGSANAALGHQALFGLTDGSNNVALGYLAGDNITTGSNNIIIGASQDAASATGSNQLNIAGLLTSSNYTTGGQWNGTLNVTSDLTVDSGTLFVDATNNTVGICDSTPPAGFTLTVGCSVGNSTINLQYQADGSSSIIFDDGNGTYQMGYDSDANKFAIYGSGAEIVLGGAGVNLTSLAGEITVGTSDTTGTLFVLDTKTDAGDPTGVEGGIYYNSNAGKFRCYENSTWKDCISAGGSSLFTDGGAQTYLTATGDELSIGGSGTSVGAKLSIIGDADEEQLLIRAYSSQTVANPLILFQKSDGSEMARINVDDNHNLSFGELTNSAISTGTGNVAFGGGALYTNATGNNNVAVGLQASEQNSAGVRNISLGFQNMMNSEGGSDNVSLGYLSLQANTGTDNIALGAGSLYSNAAGNHNIAMGSQALEQNSAGSNNIALGQRSMMNSEGGSHNIALGFEALYSNTSTHNIALGYMTLYNNTGTRNIVLGESAGNSSTTADGNILLGYQAGNSITTGDQNIVIGYDMDVASITGSNQLNIAGILTSSNYSTGNLVVGTSDTTGQLFVLDTKTDSGDPTGVNGGMYYNSNANKFRCYQNGAWADCITSPGGLFTDGGNVSYLTSLTDQLSVGSSSDLDGKLQVVNDDAADSGFVIRAAASQSAPLILAQASGGTELFRLHSDANSLFLGFEAGMVDDLTTNYNTGVGRYALNAVTTGGANVALGSGALRDSGTAVASNTAVGYESLRNNDGSFNVGVGRETVGGGSTGNTGNNNTAVGHQSLDVLTSGSDNTSLGQASLGLLTSGSGNVALGYQAGDNLTSGSNNIIIGQGLDFASSTGSNQLNIAGILTSSNYSTGNLVVGTSDTTGQLFVLDTKTDSGDPTGVNGGMYYNSNANKFRCYQNGAWADCITSPGGLFTDGGNVSYLTSLTDQLSIGSSSDLNGKLQVVNDDTADYTLLLKNAASQTAPVLLVTNSSDAELFRLHAPDNQSIFMGYASGANSPVNGYNTAVGYNTLNANSAGVSNSAFGYNALQSSTGSQNTAIGTNAFSGSYTGAGGVAIGYGAGDSATSADGNIFLGYQAGENVTTGDQNIVIGYDLDAASATGSNQLNIAGILTSSNYANGNLVVGTSDTTGQLLVVDTKTNAGDPTGTNGGMYYNSALGRFRCYENGVWKDCIGSGTYSGATVVSDNFNDNSIDAAIWNTTGTVSETGQQLVITKPTSAWTGSYVLSDNAYTLAGTYSTIEITAASDPSEDAEGGIFLRENGDTNAQLFWGIQAGDILAYHDDGGSNVELYRSAFSSTTHRFLRIREAAGTIYWESSADGSNWVIRGSVANPLDTSTVYIGLEYFSWTSTASDTLTLDNFAMVSYGDGVGGSGGSSLFTDAGTQTYLTATADELVVGGNASLSAKLSIVGTSNQEQLLIRAHSAQTNAQPLILFQNSTGSTELARLNVDASSNVALGAAALSSVSLSGQRNTAISYNALLNNTSGSNNTAIGYQALRDNTTTSNNIAIGDGALTQNASGNDNVALGYQAMLDSEGGQRNIALGSAALYSNTGSSNFAAGYNALNNNTSGGNSIAIGDGALSTNAGGSNNIAMGFTSMYGSEGGSHNLGLGSATLYNLTGSNNIALGQNAGDSATSADGNIFLGYQAGENVTTGDQNIIIGYDLDAASATGSNQLNIAGLLTSSDYTAGGQWNGTLTVTGATALNSTLTVTGATNLNGALTVSNYADFDYGLSSPFGGFGRIANAIDYSEDFANGFSNWTTSNVTVSTDTTLAPNGIDTTADTLTSTAAGGSIYNENLDGAKTVTYSVWVKTASGTQPFSLRIDAPSGTPATGTAASYTATTTWRRYHVTQTVTGSPTTYRPRIIITNNGASIIVWGAQMVTGDKPGAYMRTEGGGSYFDIDETGLAVNGRINLDGCLFYGVGDVNAVTSMCYNTLRAPGNDYEIESDTLTLGAGNGTDRILFNLASAAQLTTGSNMDLNVAPNGTGNITVGTSDTTGTLLVLDTKTGSGDPTGVQGAMYYNSNSHKFRCYEAATGSGAGGWKDCISTGSGGPSTRMITLNAEYAGGTLYADGSNNSGTMITDYDPTNRHNYYEWSSSQGTAQDYDIVIKHQLPSDFSATNEFKASSFKIRGWVTNTTNAAMVVTITDEGGTACLSAVTIEPGSNSTWAQTTLNSSTINSACTLTPNENITISIKLTSQSPNTDKVRVADIVYEYDL